MTEGFNQYFDLFSIKDIGQLGIEFFNTIGHLCTNKPEFVEDNPITLIKEDLNSFVNLGYEDIEDLSNITQIAYIGRVNNSIFEKKVEDGFISYYAVDVDAEFETCAAIIKNIQKVLMKCSSRHTIVLYRVNLCFILAYGYRNVGKNSNVVYSDWIFDDESADIIINSAAVWNLSFRNISKFAFDFRSAIHRDTNSKNLSFEAIAYDVFPQFFDDWGFSEENLPRREDRNEFVAWYYKQHRDEYDGFDDDSFFLTKDNLLEDDYEIDIDELELRMLEAEMRGEEFIPLSDTFEGMDYSEFEEAIRIVDSGTDLSDAELVLKEVHVDDNNDFDVEKAISVPDTIEALERSLPTQSLNVFSSDLVSGTIDEIMSIANPKLPFKLRRTTWKRTELFFVVENIRGKYAYGYILDGGQIDRKTSYPTFNEKLKWFLQKDETEPIIVYKGVNAEVILYSAEYIDNDEESSIELCFEIKNLTDSELNVYLKNICCGIEEIADFKLIETVDYFEPINTGKIVITDDMLSIEYLSEVYDISFMIEIDDSEFNDIETSKEYSISIT